MKQCAFIVAIVLAFITAGFSSARPSISGKIVPMQASALTQAEAWSTFQKSEEARHAAKSYRSKMISNQEGRQMEVDSEVMCPDRHHTKMMQGGQPMSEMWVVGGTMYMNAGGRVMKMPSRSKVAPGCPGSESGLGAGAYGGRSGHSSMSMQEMKDFMKYKDRSRVTKGGISTVEGAPCQEWNIVSTDPQTNKISNFQYCIGVGDSLPRRMSSTSPEGNKFEVIYWDWNKNISINPPSE